MAMWTITWTDENDKNLSLTGEKFAVQSVKEAVEFFDGNKNVKIYEVSKPKNGVKNDKAK